MQTLLKAYGTFFSFRSARHPMRLLMFMTALSLIRKVIAHAPLCENQLRMRRILFNLLSEPPDMNVYGPKIAFLLPYRFQQLFSAEYRSPVCNKHLQQVKFLRRQINLAAVDDDISTDEVYR